MVFSSRLWGGALRDDTKNGCVADYRIPKMCAIPPLVSASLNPIIPIIVQHFRMREPPTMSAPDKAYE